MLKLTALVAVLCVIGAGAPSARAQQTVNLGSVSGRVMDQTGAVVVAAEVTARQTQTNQTTDTTTDEEGRFRLAYLSVGPYEITVREQGFQDVVRGLVVSAGAAFELPVTLNVSGIDTSVTVSADPITLESARTQIAATVADTEVRSLPMNGRQFLDLALLIPDVSPTNTASKQLFAETSAVPGQGLSIGSQRNFSNSFIVDGLSANDDAAGLSGIPYSVDAIEQFQVVTSGGQAELGRALGGYINMVTKSGANVAHGDAYGYFRDDSLNAPNALSGTTLPMDQKQYGASLGGPVRQTGRSISAMSNSVGSINPVSSRFRWRRRRRSTRDWRPSAIPGRRSRPASIPIRSDSTNVLGKLDHQVGGGDLLSVRYGQYRRDVEQLAWCRRHSARRAPRPVSTTVTARRREQHVDVVGADGERDPRAVHLQQPESPANRRRSVQPSASPAWRPLARSRAVRRAA